MIELKRNENTGILEVWKSGKKIGEVITMGDLIGGDDDAEDDKVHNRERNSKDHRLQR